MTQKLFLQWQTYMKSLYNIDNLKSNTLKNAPVELVDPIFLGAILI